MKRIKTYALVLLVLLGIKSQALTDTVVSPFLEPNVQKLIAPIVAIESWGVYSVGESNAKENYANRNDLLFRRFRLGAKGNPYPWFSYAFQLNLDRFGEGVYTPIKGSYKGIGVWNAYITLKVLKNSELLNVHVGHYWAAVSREFNTSAWAVGSFDKLRSDALLRNFVTGEGNGITNGFGLGGLKNYNRVGFSYRLGVYEPTRFISANKASYLYTARLMLSLGEAEQKKYSYMLSGNQWRKRKGVSLGFGASSLSGSSLYDTLAIKQSTSLGADVLVNYSGFRFDAAYYLMDRSADGIENYSGNQWHVRLAYSLLLWNKYIEPVVSYDQYNGAGNKLLYDFIGDDKTLDVGVNWYINQDKMKAALHYVMQEGNISKTRDYIGLALQFRL